MLTLLATGGTTAAGHLGGFDFGWILTPVVFLPYSLAGITATIEYVTTWNGEWYSVEKRG